MQRYGENNDFQIGIDIANDVAEDTGDVDVLLNDEFSEEFDTSSNNICIFASEFISHLREGNRRTQAWMLCVLCLLIDLRIPPDLF